MKYFLIIFWMSHAPVQFGPFDDLLACEKASSQVRVLSLETQRASAGAVSGCLAVKSYAFTFKDTGKPK